MLHIEEIAHLSEKQKKILKLCKEALSEVDPSVQAILYGSRARGDAYADSDYDILLITDGEPDLIKEDQFRRKLFNIELETGYVFSITLYSKKQLSDPVYKEMPFIKNIKKDGISI